MALELRSDIQAAFSELFDKRVQRQMNRKAVLLSRLTKKRGGGKNLAWDVEFSGASAGTFTEGADVAGGDLAQDIKVPATLSWGLYRSSFGVSGLAKAVAMSSITSPEQIQDLVGDDLIGSATKLASQLNKALYNGSGAGAIIGLQTQLAASGTYANIDRGTYSEWAGNVNANGGIKRALTKFLLDDMERRIYEACGEMPTIYVTTPKIAQKYEALFDSLNRTILVKSDLSAASGQGGQGPEWDHENGETGLNYKGNAILRDKDCPTSQFFMLCGDYLTFEAVPPGTTAMNDTGVGGGELELEAGNFGEAGEGNEGDTESVGIPVHYQKIAKLGDSDRFSLVVYPQVKNRRCNAGGYIDDIDET